MEQTTNVGGSAAGERATFGAGCFWGVESRFRKLTGVMDATVGYMGGDVDHPTYQMVCHGDTGHTEVVEVVFDPKVLSYESLVESFFELHDPTQVDRQGPDVGRQYRSVIFTHSPEQHNIATAVRQRLDASGRWPAPIATAIESAPTFWRAEEYHQQYLAKNGGQCSV